MRDLKYIIIFLIIIIFSGLGVSYFKEGLDCTDDEYNSNGICIQKKSANNIYVVILLVIIIVWLVMLKRET